MNCESDEEQHEDTDFVICGGIVVPESALLKHEKMNRYGSVPGLEDEELADPDELERQVYRQEFEAILQLPKSKQERWIRPSVDEEGNPDWGAFGTVDFERRQAAFDKARCKADHLKEQLRDLVIQIDIARHRIPGNHKYKLLKYVAKGWMDVDEIDNPAIWWLGKQVLRAVKLKKQIAELRKASWRRKVKQARAWLDA